MLRGAGTRFGTWFYAMIRVIRLQLPLEDTIHTAQFRELNLNESARQAVLDIENKTFFKAIYTVVRAVFPALRLLRYCDANRPAMDKIFYLAYRTTVALNLSIPSLNDEDIFGEFGSEDADLSREAVEVFGEEEEEEEEEAGAERYEKYILLWYRPFHRTC